MARICNRRGQRDQLHIAERCDSQGAGVWLDSTVELRLEELCGIPGVVLGSYLADRYGARDRHAYALIPALALFCTLPCYAVGTELSMGPTAFVFFLIPSALQLVWLGPVIMAIEQLVPRTMRSLASAVFLFINNLLGLGLGALVIGVTSDQLAAHFGSASLRYAILGGTGFYVLAACLFLLAAARLQRDFEPFGVSDAAIV